jgi:GDPmannose 4,6-dehydratase
VVGTGRELTLDGFDPLAKLGELLLEGGGDAAELGADGRGGLDRPLPIGPDLAAQLGELPVEGQRQQPQRLAEQPGDRESNGGNGTSEHTPRPLSFGFRHDRGLKHAPRISQARLNARIAKRALITGISGQDGSYLAELLLDKGYEVHGLVRGSTDAPFPRLRAVQDRLVLHAADLLDEGSLFDVIRKSLPDEIYNLAAMSSVSQSWRLAVATAEYTAVGVTRLLEAIREIRPETRFYQASSSEMFGHARETPQSERTPFYPRSPYGVAKVYGHFITVNYRESYGMHACSGILFNHESPRRGKEFVTRRISRGAAAVKLGLADELTLGNLEVRRDWGYAKEYVEAMWLMLQGDSPDDYVIGTGVGHSVRDLVRTAFACVGLNYEEYVRVDPDLARPAEIEEVVADASKAGEMLGWAPKVSFEELVDLMVRVDLDELSRSAS